MFLIGYEELNLLTSCYFDTWRKWSMLQSNSILLSAYLSEQGTFERLFEY